MTTASREREVAAADELRSAVSSRSDTIGDIVGAVDSWAITLGSWRVSLWDVLVMIAIIAFCLILAKLGARFARGALRRSRRLDKTQELLAEKLVTIAIWAAVFFLAVDLLAIDLTALTVFSGAFGLAIGFGLQKTFGNLIAGIILLMDKSIKPGDVIAVTDMAGNESFGQIRKIGIRAVSLVTRDRKEYLIPNENLMINQVENWSYSSREVRVKAPVGVAYDTDIALAEKLMHRAAVDSPRVLDTPEPKVLLMGFGESAINFEIRFWILDPEEGVSGVRSEVYKRLWRLFGEHGIEIPFPQRDVNLRGEQFSKLIETLGGRPASREAGQA